MNEEIGVSYLSISGGFALFDNDDIVPIDSYMTEDGSIHPELPNDGVLCVLLEYKGTWATLTVADFIPPRLH